LLELQELGMLTVHQDLIRERGDPPKTLVRFDPCQAQRGTPLKGE
jgi:hypothetical protein